MKAKKGIWIPVAIFIFLVLCLLCIPVYAHSGGTDSNGGHTDSSTGDYHYHHGYSAHDHYDMDGDGDVDCPYDFDDKTGENSGSSSSNSSTPKISLFTTPKPTSTPSPTSAPISVKTEGKAVPTWIYWVIAILGLSLIISIINHKNTSNEQQSTIDYLHDELEKQNKKHKSESEVLSKKHDDEMAHQRDLMAKAVARVKDTRNKALSDLVQYISDSGIPAYDVLCCVPEGDILGEDSLPATPDNSKHKWGAKYTFYTAHSYPRDKTSTFHSATCHHATGSYPVNAYSIANNRIKYKSCLVCCPSLPDTDWVIKYKRIKEILDTES